MITFISNIMFGQARILIGNYPAAGFTSEAPTSNFALCKLMSPNSLSWKKKIWLSALSQNILLSC